MASDTFAITVAELHRLAKLARERELVLYQDDASDAWYCASPSDPCAPYFVTGASCTCREFLRRQRCLHHALLLSHLGWLPPAPPTGASGVPIWDAHALLRPATALLRHPKVS